MHEIFAEAVNRLEWVLIVLAIVIVVGPWIAERLRLPGLIGLILGGLVLGPYVLGLLPEGALDAIGGIGLLFLMFMAGAELDLNLFQRYRSAAMAFGLATFLGPFLLGMFASMWLGLATLAAILMGSVWASHTLVAYPTVREAGISGNKAVATSVGATVITDTLALLVLAVVSALTRDQQSGETSNPVFIVVKLLAGLALLYVYCMVFLPRFARWFYVGPGQDRLLRFVFIVGALASSGLLAVIVGMEGIVGAFFAGLGLNRMIPNGGRLMEQVEFFSSSFFIPAFLVSVGMLINPAVLFSWNTIFTALIFFAALALGKLLAAWWAGRRYKFSQAEVGVMFSLTIAQAAATLASTMVGYEIGLFGDEIVNAVLLVVLVSLILTSLGTSYFSARVKPDAIVVKPLGKTVVVPVAPSPNLERLMTFAADIAYADSGVVVPVVVVPEHEVQASRPIYEKLLRSAEECGSAAGADVEGVLRIDSSEHLGVIRQVNEHMGSFLLMSWSYNPDLKSYVFGDRTDRIGAASPIPVAAVRFAPEPAKRLILAPGLDMGSTAYRADLQVAQEIVKRLVQSKNLPLHILLPDGQKPAGLELDEQTELVSIEPGIAAIKAYIQPGDILVVPVAVVQRLIGSAAVEFSQAGRSVTLVIASSPYRLNLTSANAGNKSEAILNLAATG